MFKSNHPAGSRKEQVRKFIDSFPARKRGEITNRLLFEVMKKSSRKLIDQAIATISHEEFLNEDMPIPVEVELRLSQDQAETQKDQI